MKTSIRKSDYGSKDSKKKDLADKELSYIELKYKYYMLKIALLYLYEKSRAVPEMRRVMDEIYAVVEKRESCLQDVECNIHDIIQNFEAYPNDRERLEWFKTFILNPR